MNDSDAISITVFTTSRHSDEIPLYYSAFIVHCKSDKDIKGNLFYYTTKIEWSSMVPRTIDVVLSYLKYLTIK